MSNADRIVARTIRGLKVVGSRRSDRAEKGGHEGENVKDQENRRNTKDKALITGA
jgi:hypothetical protein